MHWIDPDYLPKTEGTVERVLVNPRGEIDGLLLADGTEVHVPPHLGERMRAAVMPGAAVAVWGVRPRHVGMIAAVAIEAGPGGRVVDDGPPEKGRGEHEGVHDGSKPAKAPPPPLLEAEGTVERALHGPKGEVRGALLADGRIVRVPPHEAKKCEGLLRAGARLAARGPGLHAEGTTVIAAERIGASLGALGPVEPKEPKHDKKRPKPPKHH